MTADKVTWEWRNFKPQGETREVYAAFFPGQHSVVSHQSHGWVGVTKDLLAEENDLLMAPGDLVLGQYSWTGRYRVDQGRVCWDSQAKCLKNDGCPEEVTFLADSKVVTVGQMKLMLPVAPYVAPTPGFRNRDLYGPGWVTQSNASDVLLVPLEASVKALGGKLYRLYGHGPLCMSFPARQKH